MQRGEVRNPVTVLVLVMCTCGIYAIIWLLKVMEELNAGLGREEFAGVKEIVFTVLSCGLWGIWMQWRMCEATVELQKSWGVEPEMDQPILFVTFLVYVGPFFLQKSLNNAWENGTPGGQGGGGFGTAPV